MKRRTLKALAALALIALTGATNTLRAQDNLRNEPGYLNLDAVQGWFDSEPWLEVNIRGSLLRLITAATKDEDPEFSNLLTRLKAIEVRGYKLDHARFDEVERRTSELSRQLRAQDWEVVARVREHQERVDVYLKSHNDAIAGMVVMVLDPSEEDGAIFVNIVGDIEPEQIGRIGQKLNIGPLTNPGIDRR